MATTCTRCNHENLPEANFCSSCGMPLSDIMDQPTEMLALDEIEGTAAVAESAVVGFLVQRGPKAGSRYELDAGTTTLGRHPESDIFLDDITVSRRHVEAVYGGEHVQVSDVGSLNGTYVNRTMIEGAVNLNDGDELQIGKFKLLFFRGERS